MVEKLQATERQLVNQSFKVPTNQGFADISNAFGQLSNFFSAKAGEIATRQAALKGAQAAEKGERLQLAPGITKATAAFNEAYLRMQGNIAALDGAKHQDKYFQEISKPGNLNSESLGLYEEFAKASIAGTLDGIDEQIRPAVALKLQQHALINYNKLSEKVSAFNLAETNKVFNNALVNDYNNLNEAVLGNDAVSVKEIFKDINQLIADRKTLGLLDEQDAVDIINKANDILIYGDYKRQHLEAIGNGNEEEFLAKLAKEKPQNLTFDRWHNVASNALSLTKEQSSLTSKSYSLSLAKWNQALVTPGVINSLEDLEPAKKELHPVDFVNLQTKFIAAQGSAAKEQVKLLELEKDMIAAPYRADSASDKTKNAAFDLRAQAALEQKREQTGDPNAQLDLVDEARIQQSMSVPAPEFNDKLSYLFLTEGLSLEKAVEALDAYKFLMGDPKKLERHRGLNLDKKADQIAFAAMHKATFGGAPAEMAIQQAQNAILKADVPEIQGRLLAFNDAFSGQKGRKDLQKRINKDLGIDASANPLVETVYKSLLKTNSAKFDNLEEAIKYTKSELENKVGTSKWGLDKNDAMFNPPEKVIEGAENGQWFYNQQLVALWQLTQEYAKAEDIKNNLDANIKTKSDLITKQAELLKEGVSPGDERVSALNEELNAVNRLIGIGQRYNPLTKVEWPFDKGLPENIDDEKLYKTDLLKFLGIAREGGTFSKTRKLKIGGKVREVGLISDASTLSRESNKPTFGWYYINDEGYRTNVPNIFSEIGLAEFAAKQLDEFLPEFFDKLNSPEIRKEATRQARHEFMVQSPNQIIDEVFISKERVEREKKRAEFLETRIPQLETEIKEVKKRRREKARNG